MELLGGGAIANALSGGGETGNAKAKVPGGEAIGDALAKMPGGAKTATMGKGTSLGKRKKR